MKIKSNLISITFNHQVFVIGSNFFISINLLRFLGLKIFSMLSFFVLESSLLIQYNYPI